MSPCCAAALVAHAVDERSDGLAAVVVERPAGEGQPAGDREGPVVADAQLGGRELHRRREARVQVEVGQVADADAGGLEGGGAGQAEDGGAVQFPAFADPHGVEAGTAGHREDPAVPGHAEGLGPGG